MDGTKMSYNPMFKLNEHIKRGDVSGFEKCLRNDCAEMFSSPGFINTVLIYVVHMGQNEIVEVILRDFWNMIKLGPLSMACLTGDLNVVRKVFLTGGDKFETIFNQYFSAEHIAVALGYTDIYNLLVAHGRMEISDPYNLFVVACNAGKETSMVMLWNTFKGVYNLKEISYRLNTEGVEYEKIQLATRVLNEISSGLPVAKFKVSTVEVTMDNEEMTLTEGLQTLALGHTTKSE